MHCYLIILFSFDFNWDIYYTNPFQPGVATSIFFLVLLYLTASWHSYAFGCGFGARNFVEYTALFALPLGFVIENILKTNHRMMFFALICLPMIFINQKLIFHFDKCFFGHSDWDVEEYCRLLKRGYCQKTVSSMKSRNEKSSQTFLGTSVIRTKNCLTFANFEQLRFSGEIQADNLNKRVALVVETRFQDSIVDFLSFPFTNYLKNKNEAKNFKITTALIKDLPYEKLSIKTNIWN